jgi:hypothetical protein
MEKKENRTSTEALKSLEQIRERLRNYRKTQQQASSTQKKKPKSKSYWKKVSEFMKIQNVTQVKLSILDPIDPQISCENILDFARNLNKSNQETPSGTQKMNSSDSQSDHPLEPYKTIIHKVGSKELRIECILHPVMTTLFYILLCFIREFLVSCWSYLLGTDAKEEGSVHSKELFHLHLFDLSLKYRGEDSIHRGLHRPAIMAQIGLQLFFIVSLISLLGLLDLYTRRLKIIAKIKMNQALSSLIFNTLKKQDLYFLEFSDNVLISRLFYADFEAYKPEIQKKDMLPVLYNFLLLVKFHIGLDGVDPTIYSVLPLYFLFFLTQGILITFKLRYSILLRELNFQIRSILYECLESFQSYHMKSLIPSFEKKLQNRRSRYTTTQNKSLFIEVILSNLTKYLPFFFFIIVVVHFNSRYQRLEDQSDKVILGFHFFINASVFFLFLMRMEELFNSFQGSFEPIQISRESEVFFDKFFGELRLNQIEMNEDPTIPKGSIRMRDCESYQRNLNTVSNVIEFILTNKIIKEGRMSVSDL